MGNIGKSLVKVEESGRERKKTSQRQYTQKQKAASVQKTKKYHFNQEEGVEKATYTFMYKKKGDSEKLPFAFFSQTIC